MEEVQNYPKNQNIQDSFEITKSTLHYYNSQYNVSLSTVKNTGKSIMFYIFVNIYIYIIF